MSVHSIGVPELLAHHSSSNSNADMWGGIMVDGGG